MINKVAVVIYKLVAGEPLFFVAKRNPDQDGVWQYVTGHVESGETFEETVLREVHEELGRVKILNFFDLKKENRFSSTDGNKYLEKIYAVQIDEVQELERAEFCEYQWLNLDKAIKIVHWDSHKDGMKTVYTRLKNGQYPKIFIFVGTTASGKNTIVNHVLEEFKNFKRLKTCTTRPLKRADDAIARSYLSVKEFERMYEQGEILERNFHDGNWYGVCYKNLEEQTMTGQNIVTEIDINGLQKLKEFYTNIVSIFIYVDLDDVRKRIIKRNEDSESEIKTRLMIAEKEIAKKSVCDYIVNNDEGQLKRALDEVDKIIRKETV